MFSCQEEAENSGYHKAVQCQEGRLNYSLLFHVLTSLSCEVPYRTWPTWFDSQSSWHKALRKQQKSKRHLRKVETWLILDTCRFIILPSNFSASVVSCSMVRPLLVVEENCQLNTSATWSHVPTGGLVKKFTFCERRPKATGYENVTAFKYHALQPNEHRWAFKTWSNVCKASTFSNHLNN